MTKEIRQVELDGLRLIGLGRVPRCTRCPRYANLVEHYVDSRAATTRLAPIPADCEHCYCAPLARRYNASPPQLPLVEARVAS
jgi:hypothetical protein